MEWLNTLSDIGLPTIILVISGLIGLIKFIEMIYKWGKEKFIYLYNRKRKTEQLTGDVEKHEKEIGDIKLSQLAISNGMQILLKENLKKLHKEFITKGNLTSDEFEDYQFQYDTYHSLGGNGTGTKWYEEVKALPIID